MPSLLSLPAVWDKCPSLSSTAISFSVALRFSLHRFVCACMLDACGRYHFKYDTSQPLFTLSIVFAIRFLDEENKSAQRWLLLASTVIRQNETYLQFASSLVRLVILRKAFRQLIVCCSCWCPPGNWMRHSLYSLKGNLRATHHHSSSYQWIDATRFEQGCYRRLPTSASVPNQGEMVSCEQTKALGQHWRYRNMPLSSEERSVRWPERKVCIFSE